MTDTTIETFRNLFPAIMQLVDASGSHHVEITPKTKALGIDPDIDNCAAAHVTFKHKMGLAFTALWLLDRGEILHTHYPRYRVAGGDDPENQEWLKKFERRLQRGEAHYRDKIAHAKREGA